MRFINWAESFKEQPTCDDILKRVRKTEITYWIFIIISVAIALGGFDVIGEAPDDNLKEVALGLAMIIIGIVNVAVMKLWAHIRLTMYFIIWDRKTACKPNLINPKH